MWKRTKLIDRYSDGSLPVEEACKVLIKNNISSAPVYDSRNNHNGKVTEYVGMFDYGDVIAYILLVLMDQMPPHMQEPSGDDDLTEVTDLIRRAVEGQQVPVRLASGKRERERKKVVGGCGSSLES